MVTRLTDFGLKMGSLVILWSLFCGSAANFIEPQLFFAGLSFVFMALAWLRPNLAIALFLGLMPFLAGDQPASQNTIHFLEAFLGLLLGLQTRGLEKKIPVSWKTLLYHPLVFTLVIYWVVAGLSLSTISISRSLMALIWPNPLGAYSFIAQNECDALYPWLAWYQLTGCLLLGWHLIQRLSLDPSWGIRWSLSLTAGLLFSEILGILDFYSFLDLNPFRSAPGGLFQHQSLTSLFGNPGWYAQFITVATPVVLAILSLRWSVRLRIGLILGIMILSEFTLILVHQRGGWISYPLTLLVVWICIYVLREGQQSSAEIREKIWRLLPKILISFPLTIIVSIGLIALITKIGQELGAPLPSTSVYVDRAKSIQNTGQRMAYWDPISTMLNRHPILGFGNESYCRQFESLYGGPNPPLKLSQWAFDNDVMNGSAHNLYFQAIAGKGILGLLSLLALMFVAIRTSWSSMFFLGDHRDGASTPSYHHRLFLMMGFAYTMALAIYGNVGEMFYTPIGYILLAFFFSMIVGAAPRVNPIRHRTPLIMAILLAASLLAHLYWEYVDPGMTKKSAPSNEAQGCYGKEQNPLNSSESFRWCSDDFTLKLPVEMIGNKRVVHLHLGAPKPPGYPALLRIRGEMDGEIVLDTSLITGEHKDLWIKIPESHLEAEVSIQFDLDRAFIPSVIPEMASPDQRVLGVQWYFHQEGACYPVEGDPLDPLTQFRWCTDTFKTEIPFKEESDECVSRMVVFTEPQRPLTIQMRYQGVSIVDKSLTPGSFEVLEPRIPLKDLKGGCASIKDLDVSTDAFFVPSLENPDSPDGRRLAIRWYFAR